MSLGDRRRKNASQDEQLEALDDLELFEAWKPLLKKLGKRPGELTGQEVVDAFGALGPLVMAEIMLHSKNDRTRVVAAKEMAYMSGLKPVERSQNLNVNVLAEAEIDALLRSKFGELGITVIEDSGPRKALARTETKTSANGRADRAVEKVSET